VLRPQHLGAWWRADLRPFAKASGLYAVAHHGQNSLQLGAREV